MNNNNNQTTENTQTNTSESTNTTFVDQAPLTTEFAQQTPVLPKRPQVIPDQEWFAAQQLSKPIVVEDVQWTSIQAYNTTLWTAAIPDVLQTIDSLQSRTLRMYAFYRANWVIRFQLNGTQFHEGQLIAGLVPFNLRIDGTDLIPGGFSAIGLTGFPSVQISASATAPVELKIPFIHLYDYLMTNAANEVPLGQIYLKVLNPLLFSDGASPALTLTVSMYAEEPEVHVPMYDHDIVALEEEEKYEATGLFDNVAASIGHLSTGNFKGFFNSGSKAQKDMASLFDKPAYVATELKTITPISALSHGKGTETTIRLGLDPSAQAAKPAEVFGGVDDEMTVSHVASTPMMFHSFTWNDTQPSGTLLTHWPVNPRLSYLESGTGEASIWQPTFLAWISSLFTFWRGGIEYEMDAICTSFHTGRLLVAFVPNGFPGTGPNLTAAYSCPNVIVDIQSTTKVKFSVPFLSNLPYKNVLNQEDPSSTTGWVYIYVLNQLVHPSNVAGSVAFNLYTNGAPDFELSVPRDNLLYLGPIEAKDENEEEYVMTSAYAPVQETITEKEDCNIALTFGDPNLRRLNRFGEDFPLIDVIKRYGVCNGFVDNVLEVGPRVNSLINGDKWSMNPMYAISQIFAAWYGTIRYKFIFDAPRTTENVVMFNLSNVLPTATNPINVGNPLYATNLAQDSGIEVEVPCYINTNLAISPTLTGIVTQPKYTRSGFLSMTQTAATPIQPKYTYTAAGDDFQMYYLIAPPTVRGDLFKVKT